MERLKFDSSGKLMEVDGERIEEKPKPRRGFSPIQMRNGRLDSFSKLNYSNNGVDDNSNEDEDFLDEELRKTEDLEFLKDDDGEKNKINEDKEVGDLFDNKYWS